MNLQTRHGRHGYTTRFEQTGKNQCVCMCVFVLPEVKLNTSKTVFRFKFLPYISYTQVTGEQQCMWTCLCACVRLFYFHYHFLTELIYYRLMTSARSSTKRSLNRIIVKNQIKKLQNCHFENYFIVCYYIFLTGRRTGEKVLPSEDWRAAAVVNGIWHQ